MTDHTDCQRKLEEAEAKLAVAYKFLSQSVFGPGGFVITDLSEDARALLDDAKKLTT